MSEEERIVLVVVVLRERHHPSPLMQKPPRFPSTACAVALHLRRGLLRRAVLERSPSLLATGRKAFIE